MELNIADLIESVADAIPEREALVSGKVRLTYAELDRRANRLAHYLHENGVRAGDHVGMYLFNGHEYVEALLAAFKIRAVPVNVNYRYVEEELRYLLGDADLKALVFHREFAPTVGAVLGSLPELRTLVHVEDGSGAECSGIGSEDYETALAGASDARDFPPRSGKDIYIIYTGGTTGMPKGVMWRHEDVFYAGLQGGNPGGEPLERADQVAENAKNNPMALTFFPAAPFIHGAAQWSALIGLFSGGKIVVLPGRSFVPEEAARLISDEKINTITLVGDAMARPLIEAFEKLGDTIDASSLIVIGSAGAVLSEAVKEKFREVLDSVMILDNFGSTEAGHQGTMMAGTGHGTGEAPRFLMNDTNCVFDDDMKPVVAGSGVVGKLARRGHLPVGYYNDPEKTARTFVEVDGQRWVIPGDMATVEEDGTICVFGRGSVCINSGGEKIFPEEVEAALKAHPEVLDAVVVGIPDPRWGQKVSALVQPRGESSPDVDALVEHCRTKVAGYKVPRHVFLIDHIERHPSGKPDYRWAKETATEAAGV